MSTFWPLIVIGGAFVAMLLCIILLAITAGRNRAAAERATSKLKELTDALIEAAKVRDDVERATDDELRKRAGGSW